MNPHVRLRAPRVAAHSGGFQESVIREMSRLGEETAAVNLSQGLPDFPPPPSVLAAAIAGIKRGTIRSGGRWGRASRRLGRVMGG